MAIITDIADEQLELGGEYYIDIIPSSNERPT